MKNRKQKTISITISLAMAVLFATPLMAQNIHDVVCPPEDGHHCYTSIFSSQDKQNAMNSQQMQELALKLGSDLVQAAIPNFEITDEVKYLNVNLLLRQLEENSLVFNSEEEATAYYQNLFEITSNSMKANKIGDFDQYELMSLAIKKNQNRVLEQLLKAGFDPQVDLKIKIIEDDGQEHPAMPLTEIAEDVNNTEAVTLLQEYQQKKEDILNEQRAKAEERHITPRSSPSQARSPRSVSPKSRWA